MGDWDGHCGLVRCCFWRPARLSAAALALALPAPGGTALRFNGGAADRVDLDKQIGAGTECDQALEFGKKVPHQQQQHRRISRGERRAHAGSRLSSVVTPSVRSITSRYRSAAGF
ncbi:MAG TPA: hypothetical protein VM223_21465 [Planctomycetota bacterium]|nr:hypothetical protein [Planctomycetota bacterium]